MGEDKRFLLLGAETLLERSLAMLRATFESIVVVIAQDSAPMELDVPVIRDLVPAAGSLGGLFTGLTWSDRQRIFAVACDMPFLSATTIRAVVAADPEADVVMTRLDQGLQPMHAVYGKRALPVMQDMLRRGELKIQQVVSDPSLRTHLLTAEDLRAIDPSGRSFLNVNTPSDLAAARQLLAAEPGSASR